MIFNPVIEPDLKNFVERFLITDPQKLLKNKTFYSVPVITGFTEYEIMPQAVGMYLHILFG